MKQLLPLFLFLLPCLAWAQYPSNGNQKITLGEQTTADGLIFRGVFADTGIITPSSDTSAYIILDTVNHRFYNYNRATNVWSMAGVGSISSGLTGVLPVANGGTGQTTLAAANIITGTGTTNTLPLFTSSNTLGNSPISVITGVVNIGADFNVGTLGNLKINAGSAATPLLTQTTNYTEIYRRSGGVGIYLGGTGDAANYYDNTSHFFRTSGGGSTRMTINNSGNVGIGTETPQSGYRLHVVDSVYVGGNVSASAYTTRSDYNLKDDIFDIKYGLNDVLQLQPVEYTYKSNGSKQLGFIAQDIGTILPEVVSFEESMSVNYQAIIPILTKAIQEQQALIKALEQRIINLENK
jgi:hypothetical protein